MGFLLGRNGRNKTDGRRGSVGKESVSLLAAVAVAEGISIPLSTIRLLVSAVGNRCALVLCAAKRCRNPQVRV